MGASRSRSRRRCRSCRSCRPRSIRSSSRRALGAVPGRPPGGGRATLTTARRDRAPDTCRPRSGWPLVAVSRHLLAVRPRLRRRPGRLLLSGRCLPPRPDLADVPARAARRDHRSTAASTCRSRRSRRSPSCRSSRSSAPSPADQVEAGHQRPPGGGDVGMCWWLVGRIGVKRLPGPVWLALLFGFSTQILWVTTRGGVWHTGQLIATILTFACLLELWGSRRAWLIGLLAGAAFLTRAPLAFAIPFYALLLDPAPASAGRDARRLPRSRRPAIPWRRWPSLALGVLPSLVFFFAYNQVRFGSTVGIRLCARDPAAVPRAAAGARPVRARPRPDEPRLLVLPPADVHPGRPVLQAGRPRAVRVHHQPGAALSRSGPTGATARWWLLGGDASRSSSRRCSTTAAAGSSTATAISSTRCRSSSPCAGGRGTPRPDRIRLAGPDRVRGRGHGVRASTGRTSSERRGAYVAVPMAGTPRARV